MMKVDDFDTLSSGYSVELKVISDDTIEIQLFDENQKHIHSTIYKVRTIPKTLNDFDPFKNSEKISEIEYCPNGTLKHHSLPFSKPFIRYHCNGKVAMTADSAGIMGTPIGNAKWFNDDGSHQAIGKYQGEPNVPASFMEGWWDFYENGKKVKSEFYERNKVIKTKNYR
jgi:antitoxin component YwqK of YwqJK toxin-antitoxin module